MPADIGQLLAVAWTQPSKLGLAAHCSLDCVQISAPVLPGRLLTEFCLPLQFIPSTTCSKVGLRWLSGDFCF